MSARNGIGGRIGQAFARTQAQGRIALMPYLPVGYPDVETTVALAPALARAGADLFELGIPYSDPLADGATIQRATHVALENGVTPALCLEVASAIRRAVDAPILLMSYYNPIARFGPERFCRQAAAAGADGLIVPDLPPEEADELRGAARANALDLIFLVAPTSTDERLRLVAAAATGFLYCVSLAGVTGARAHLASGLADYLTRVRRVTSLPLAVGFGISRPEHVRQIARYADGAIVASALIDRLDALPRAEQVAGAAAFIRDLATEAVRP
ncbi:MAG: tryptophan synthase subunit alpha [Chloroflexi bacterium]|nr:tryptophan synthase subunit alpha [Chloroflexota bacterium]